jgi:CheY-like chemotaxis protein
LLAHLFSELKADMKTILVAEDRDVSRELIRTILEHLGYTVLEARDGLEALGSIRSNPPDLVLLDIQMPKMNGYDVMTELRSEERFQRLPIVALTASAMSGDREHAISRGFTSYLAKPVTIATMQAELNRWLP